MIALALLVSASLVTEAKQVLAEHSVNPAAVQFIDVREGAGIVCGKINRPNRAGGYDGFRPFVYYSRDRWSFGTIDGLVVEGGKLVDMGYLNDRITPASNRFRAPTERDFKLGEEYNAGLTSRLAQLKGCSSTRATQLDPD